jgi:Domain of unknown function (DUF4326)
MCKVLSAREVGKRPRPDRVYVGRPSKWGNPFVIGRDGSRGEVMRNTAHGLCSSERLCPRRTNCAARISCAGVRPERCHADVLIELANP